MQIADSSLFVHRQGLDSQKMDTLQKRNYSEMEDKRMKEVSADFEALFIDMLFKTMRKTVPKDEWLNGGLKQDIFEDMLYQEYSKKIAKTGGIGLGDMVYNYLKTQKNDKV